MNSPESTPPEPHITPLPSNVDGTTPPHLAMAYWMAEAAKLIDWVFIDKLHKDPHAVTNTNPNDKINNNSGRETKSVCYTNLENNLNGCSQALCTRNNFTITEEAEVGITARANIGKLYFSLTSAYAVAVYAKIHENEYADETFPAERINAIKEGLKASLIALGKAAAIKFTDNNTPTFVQTMVPTNHLYKGQLSGIIQQLYPNQDKTNRQEKASVTQECRECFNWFRDGVNQAREEIQGDVAKRIFSTPDDPIPGQ